jgi:hypothetical protein
MAIEDGADREIYTGIARYWYNKVADINPDLGRVQHHLGVLARPNMLQQLFYYSKALTSIEPFPKARDSILHLFSPLLDCAKAEKKQVSSVFVEAHGVLFTRQHVSTFPRLADEFLSQLDGYAGSVGPSFQEPLFYIAASNYAAIFDYGHDNAKFPAMFDQAGRSHEARSELLDKACKHWQNPNQLVTVFRIPKMQRSPWRRILLSPLSASFLDIPIPCHIYTFP